MGNFISDFNNGKGIALSDVTGTAKPGEIRKCYIQNVTATSEVSTKTGKEWFALDMIVFFEIGKDKERSARVRQFVQFDTNGKMFNPAMPSSDVEKYPEQPIYEFLKASKEFDAKSYEKHKAESLNKDGTRDWKGFLEGLEFEFEVKDFDAKDNKDAWAKIMTSKQKEADAKWYEDHKDDDREDRKPAPTKTELAKAKVAGAKNIKAVEEVFPENGEINPDDLPF